MTVGTITAHVDGTTTVVVLAGEIDTTMRDQASHALADAVRGGVPVVADLRYVDFLDSSGVAFLLQCRRACAELGVGFTVRHVPPRAAEVLRVLGLTEVLGPDGA
jgi:anti-sigma B factor antagonist